jgi:hypothetical protein
MKKENKVIISGVQVTKSLENEIVKDAEANGRSRASHVAYILKKWYEESMVKLEK